MKHFSITSLFLSLFGLLFILSCEENNTYIQSLEDPVLFNESMQQLSDVIVYDIFSPPVASRVYMYPTVAAYSIMQQAFPEKYEDLEGQISGFTSIPSLSDPKVNPHLAAIHAFLKVGTALIFSENKMDSYREALYEKIRRRGASLCS